MRIRTILLLPGIMVCAAGCKGKQEQQGAHEVWAQTDVSVQEDTTQETEEKYAVESTVLLQFDATIKDLTDGTNVGYSYHLKMRTDGAGADLRVIAHPLIEGYEDAVAEAVIDKKALEALQALLTQEDMIGSYCSGTSPEVAAEDVAGLVSASLMHMVYESGEEATHESAGEVEISAQDALALKDFFYGLLAEENIRFYGMDNTYDDEEYLDAFLCAAPFDPLVTEDGTTLLLSFGEGRVFTLTVADETAAGNYKRRVQTKEGRRGTDTLTVTLTTWPAAWTQMMNGGSFIVEKLAVTKGDVPATGTESVTIRKNGTNFSLFDDYFTEDGTLTFTRNYTALFAETQGEEAEEEAGE